MANLKNSKKAILVNERNRLRNQSIKTLYKSAIKNALEAISANTAESKEIVLKSCQIIDKTASKGIIKKQTAARNKSNLMNLLNTAAKVEKPKKEAKKAAPAKKAPKAKAAAKTTKKTETSTKETA